MAPRYMLPSICCNFEYLVCTIYTLHMLASINRVVFSGDPSACDVIMDKGLCCVSIYTFNVHGCGLPGVGSISN